MFFLVIIIASGIFLCKCEFYLISMKRVENEGAKLCKIYKCVRLAI